MFHKSSESGQILLIVVITMIVALTVGLTIASRTITELKISKQNEESQRAFNAAEAGIDRVLQQGVSANLQDELGNNAEFVVDKADYSGAELLLNNGEQVDQDIGADVWLSNHPQFENPIPDGTTLTFYWGEPGQTVCNNTGAQAVAPALEIVILNGPQLSPTIEKYLYDVCGNSRAVGFNSNVDSPGAVQGEDFLYSATITNTSGLILKVIPLFNSTRMAVVASEPLPSQGSVIESTGTSGDTVRRITYFQSYPQLPLEIFPYTIISQ